MVLLQQKSNEGAFQGQTGENLKTVVTDTVSSVALDRERKVPLTSRRQSAAVQPSVVGRKISVHENLMTEQSR
jgi:hypothetical protein